MENAFDTRSWKDLGFGDKLKYSIAGTLVFASILLGFVSFIILFEIPGSVIGLSGLWLSTALAVLGISSYFHNELVSFQNKVTERLDKINNNEDNAIPEP